MLLCEHDVPKVTLIELRKLTPSRQLASARIMVSTGVFNRTFARVLVARSPDQDLLPPIWPRGLGLLSREQVHSMKGAAAALDDRFLAMLETQRSVAIATAFVRALVDQILNSSDCVTVLATRSPEMLCQLATARRV
jgi:hypothetical protein